MPPNSRVADSTRQWNLTPLMASFGYFERWSIIDKFGVNTNVGATYEDVWGVGDAIDFLSTAETMDIVSDDALDDKDNAAGNAHKIKLEGLDNAYNEITEEIELEGLTPVTTTKSFLRVNRAYITDIGTASELTNKGNISIDATSAGTPQAIIQADDGQTQMAIYTIPRGKTGYFDGAYIGVDTNNIVTGQLRIKNFGEAWRNQKEAKVTQGTIPIDMVASGLCPEKTDVAWRAKANNPNNVVTAGFKILLYTE